MSGPPPPTIPRPPQSPRVPRARRPARAWLWLPVLGGVIAVLAAAWLTEQPRFLFEEGPPREPNPPALPRDAPEGSPSATASSLAPAAGLRDRDADADARPVPSAIVELRERKLRLDALRAPAQTLAFGRGRLARLTEEGVEVFSTDTLEQEASPSLTQPRRIVALRDGSLLVAASERTLRLGPGKQPAESFPRIPLFAGTLVFADRLEEKRFWLLHEFDPTLYRYDLDAGGSVLLRMDEYLTLEGFDHRGFAGLKDGSFMFTAGTRFRRFFPLGKEMELGSPVPDTEVWRLLVTHRIDRVWVAHRGSRLDLVQIGARLRVVRTLELPGDPYDITSNDRYVAVILLRQVAGEPRHWRLVVVDQKGDEVFAENLPMDEALGGVDWVRAVTRNRNVVLSHPGSLVAVGGPTWLSVWDIEKKSLVLGPQRHEKGGP